MSDEYDFLFKSIVVGDGGVGKTALTLRFSKGFFTEDYKMTIGVDFHVKTIMIETEDEGLLRVKLQIWDTGGQERFSSIRPMYYRGSLGALLIFDLTSYESFEHLPQWIEEVRSNIKNEVPFLLVGNKSDLINERAVSLEEINSFTKKFNLYYMEASAKTGVGVGDCFYILACLMVGSGVPNQRLTNRTVFTPGNILITPPSTSTEMTPQVISSPILESEPNIDFMAPPVPEPAFEKTSTPTPILEPEIEFSAPPVPEPAFEKFSEPIPILEPEPEIAFTTPPVPKPNVAKSIRSDTSEPKIPIPEPISQTPNEQYKDFDFKTPDEILSHEIKNVKQSSLNEALLSSEAPVYKPKTIPFSSNIPVPAPPPEEFQTLESKSESLVDYMPQTIISKKEKKILEKLRKKEEKEKAKLDKEKKLQEKKEKAANLKAEMQAVGKEKKIKPKKEKKEEIIRTPEISTKSKSTKVIEDGRPSLFQALSEKTSESTQTQSGPFVPFSALDDSVKTEPSTLRIIPNVADLNNEPTIPEFTSKNEIREQPQIPGKSDLTKCSYCGAMLSSDYAFCNKCGAKL
jgi:small GTP-binding protein